MNHGLRKWTASRAANCGQTMDQRADCNQQVDLNGLVVEALGSLACLEARRLEELVVFCRALERDVSVLSGKERLAFAASACKASRELRTFAGVLEATRENLRVLTQASAFHLDRMTLLPSYAGIPSPGSNCNGND
jgi:hypothetical protein